MGIVGEHSHLGDPAGMEALAAELTGRAETIAVTVQTLHRQSEAISFEGPAATKLRERMELRRKRAERIALELRHAAEILRRRAASLHDELHELDLAAEHRKPDAG